MIKLFKGFIVILLFMVNYPMNEQKIITDRPDQTGSSSTIPKGSLQLESGLLLGFAENDNISLREILAPTMLFRYGIAKGIEIRLVNQFVSIKNKTTSKEISGIADLEIGAKIQLLKKKEVNTEIAFFLKLFCQPVQRMFRLKKLVR